MHVHSLTQKNTFLDYLICKCLLSKTHPLEEALGINGSVIYHTSNVLLFKRLPDQMYFIKTLSRIVLSMEFNSTL